ncbi:MAG: DUF2808 domain-containing protein [Cyanobacteria bacterium CRU_2_1]|nr:DUF2808 domain-containing protein [Cyanobacteria bacterium RU_5_0]NJR59467.1 DUF2808 domain-containing protein [Cyanobacteria bacterium CRU_2_1]
MRPLLWSSFAVVASLGLGGIVSVVPSQSLQAVELQDGRTYFVQPPLLEDAKTTIDTVITWNPTYYFTLSIPENAGEPLAQVVFEAKDTSTASREIRFDAEDTRAFTGTPGDRGDTLTIGNTTYDRDNQTVTVTFDPPIPPGSIVTIGLEPQRNPRQSGVYLFGVTAYPPGGETAYGQFIGYGRLQFYNDGGNLLPLSW